MFYKSHRCLVACLKTGFKTLAPRTYLTYLGYYVMSQQGCNVLHVQLLLSNSSHFLAAACYALTYVPFTDKI